MAIDSSIFDPTPREQMHELADRYKKMIGKLAGGEVPVDLPWPDPRFQKMVVSLIGDMRKYKADADKLAVIREVFSGK